MENDQTTALRRLIAANTVEEAYLSASRAINSLIKSPVFVFSVADNGQLDRRGSSPPSENISASDLPLSDHTIRHTIECHSAEIIDDLNETRSAAEQAASRPHNIFQSALVVPVGEVGVIVCYDPKPSAFGREIAVEVEIIAAILSAVIDQCAAGPDESVPSEFVELVIMVLDHDLKSPLNVAFGQLELVEQTGELDRLQKVAAALERIDEMAQTLVRYAQTQTCNLDLTPNDLESVAKRAWNMESTSGATLVIESTAQVEADVGLLTELFENLFRNSIEHGGDSVIVRVGPLADERGFFVEDNGIGIASEDYDSIFSEEYSSKEIPSGIGLYLVSKIANAHRWTIEVAESASGGARFEFSADNPISEN